MKYFDAHCHPQFPQYDADREEVLQKMKEQEVGGLVVGCDATSSRSACELVQHHDNLYASIGLHPNRADNEVFDEHLFRNLLMYPRVVAVGECGLDYYRPQDLSSAVKERQRELFLRHVRLAGTTKRPLVVHARPSKGTTDAYEDALDVIMEAKKEFGDSLRGDLHFFVGDTKIAKRAFELDFTLSFTAVITFARDYDEVIRYAPLDYVLSETDAPYVAPASRRGQRNDPLAIHEVVEALAEIRREDKETIRLAMLVNAERVFGPF